MMAAAREDDFVVLPGFIRRFGIRVQCDVTH
jgi:hypothetical protein